MGREVGGDIVITLESCRFSSNNFVQLSYAESEGQQFPNEK
jgi:hypothetical protein